MIVEDYSFEKIGERLKELVLEYNIKSIKEFCAAAGIGKTDFYRWWQNTTVPSVENAIKLADLFCCSIDFLIGREDENTATHFFPRPPFSAQLKYYIAQNHTNPFRLSHKTHLGRSSILAWLNGTSVPSLTSCIILATAFGCSVGVLLGRER